MPIRHIQLHCHADWCWFFTIFSDPFHISATIWQQKTHWRPFPPFFPSLPSDPSHPRLPPHPSPREPRTLSVSRMHDAEVLCMSLFRFDGSVFDTAFERNWYSADKSVFKIIAKTQKNRGAEHLWLDTSALFEFLAKYMAMCNTLECIKCNDYRVAQKTGTIVFYCRHFHILWFRIPGLR